MCIGPLKFWASEDALILDPFLRFQGLPGLRAGKKSVTLIGKYDAFCWFENRVKLNQPEGYSRRREQLTGCLEDIQ